MKKVQIHSIELHNLHLICFFQPFLYKCLIITKYESESCLVEKIGLLRLNEDKKLMINQLKTFSLILLFS